MKVSELIQMDSTIKYRHPVWVEGYLIMSGFLTYVVDSRKEAYSGIPHFGMIVRGEILHHLEQLDVPRLAGTSVSLTGQIKMKGTVTASGLSLLPLYMPYIYEYFFIHPTADTEYHFKTSDVFRNIYLLASQNISAQGLRAIQPLLSENLNIMQTRQLVLSQRETLIGQHLEGEEYFRRICILEENHLPYRTEECEIGFRGSP